MRWTGRDAGARAVERGVLLGLALTLGAADRLSAQWSLQLSAGVRYSSALVRDSLVTPFAVRPALAPALSLGAAMPLHHRWAARATIDFSTSGLVRHDADGSSVALGRLSALGVSVGLRHPLLGGLAATVEVGGLKYFPSEATGIFRSGAGPVESVGGLALDYPLRVSTRWRGAIEVRYDLSGFTTPALRDEGFTSARAVHRLMLALRVGGP